MNRLITTIKIQSVIKKLAINQSLVPDALWGKSTNILSKVNTHDSQTFPDNLREISIFKYKL